MGDVRKMTSFDAAERRWEQRREDEFFGELKIQEMEDEDERCQR